MRHFTALALIVTSCGFAAPMASAAEPKLAATYSDWKVYTKGSGGNQICYALAKPKTHSPRSVNHGDVFFMVANWKSGAAKEQPSLMTGYSFKLSSPPKARIGGAKIPMYVAQNEAFVEARSDETRLVKNMRSGSLMRVEAVSQRGTATSYEFSLKGITAALKKAKSLCS
ncbi:MAG: invasion associated locus B family protein [Robiginitomaculum sp.]